MKFIFAFLFILIFQFSLAQSEDEPIFAFVESTTATNMKTFKMKEADLTKNYRYPIVKKVYDDLVEAKGNFSLTIPKLILSNEERRVAVAKPRSAQIILELKAYDICASFGKDSLNAIAALLSHELIHYYEKHDWTRSFYKQHQDSELGSEIKQIKEGLKLETQADHLGGFLAYAAGYTTLDIMPQFLDKVYQEYGLPEEIRGYPSLAQRKAIAKESMAKLRPFMKLYDTANYLTALEKYNFALKYLGYIIKDFQSRELYNNLGVLSTLAAMDFFTLDELNNFRYPIELDVESRLQAIRGEDDEIAFAEKLAVRKRLLDDAADSFNKTLVLDKNYPIALLNLACVYTLNESFMDAEYFSAKALQLAQDEKWAKTKSDIIVLQGIIAAKQNDQKKAKELFEKAAMLNNYLATYNLKKLLGEELTNKTQPSKPLMSMPKLIDGVNIDAEVNSLYNGDFVADFSTEINNDITFGYKNFSNSQLFTHLLLQENQYIFIHATNATSEKTNKGIGITSTRENIIDKYGSPYRIQESSKGQILVYYKPNHIFFLDKDGVVTEWAVFRTN